MDPKLQQIVDHYEITQLLNEYCRGCDRMDPTRMAAAYASDSWDDHGLNKCPGPQFVQIAMQAMRTVEMCSHLVGQTTVKIDGDSAAAESHFIATLRRIRDDGTAALDQMGGRYLDKLVREQGSWQIRSRTCVRDWSISHTVLRDWADSLGYVAGQSSGADPCYDLLGLTHSSSGVLRNRDAARTQGGARGNP